MKERLKKHLINARGQKLKGKYLVIESDDWGSIRIPNTKIQKELESEGLINLRDPFSAYDCLESSEDYLELFNVLRSFKDKKGNHPIITANMVMGNPAFDKIKASNFRSFEWEPFFSTYDYYYPDDETFSVFKQGVNDKLMLPQYHAIVHVNHHEWLRRLQQGDQAFLKAFKLRCFAIDDKIATNHRANLMATYDYKDEALLPLIEKDIKDGLAFFEETFGFPSKTTVAPCYVWNEKIEQLFSSSSVNTLQSSYVQQYNDLKTGLHKRKWHKSGATNQNGQRYFVRNVLFEPSLSDKVDWVEKALESISIAFKWKKPAIIGTHRINYVSGLSKENRTNSILKLEKLLNAALVKWPDVQFISTVDLSNFYSNE